MVKLSVRIKQALSDYFPYSYPLGFSTLMEEVDANEKVINTRNRVDGYDLGILIRLERFRGYHDLSSINAHVISEVGWLDGGDKELLRRVSKLVDIGYLEIQTPQDDCPNYRYYMSMPKFRFVKYPESV